MFLSLLFVNITSTSMIYTLSLHDALPIFDGGLKREVEVRDCLCHLDAGHTQARLHYPECAPLLFGREQPEEKVNLDRKSTRLNSSHANISYAVFCLKKKKQLIIRCRFDSL